MGEVVSGWKSRAFWKAGQKPPQEPGSRREKAQKSPAAGVCVDGGR